MTQVKRVVHPGRRKSCHQPYEIVILYVQEGKKPKPAATTEPTKTAPSPDTKLPAWQVPSDSSLFGSSPTETNSIFSDTSSIFGEGDKNKETSTGTEQ